MTTDAGKIQARDVGTGVAPVKAQATAATALAPPAGGTGANLGGWSGSSNRDLAIASLAAQIVDMETLRVELIAMGLGDGSSTEAGRTRVRDLASGKVPSRPVVSVTATALAPPAGGTGIQAGCYGSAANRNLFIASLTALRVDIDTMRTMLKSVGFVSGGITAIGKANLRDIGSGRPSRNPPSITATASAPPAGGSGNTAGGYDGASNRDLMITSLTKTRVDVAALRTELVALNIVGA